MRTRLPAVLVSLAFLIVALGLSVQAGAQIDKPSPPTEPIPPAATDTPSPEPTATLIPTATPTDTPTTIPTDTPRPTDTPVPTDTPAAIPTDTPAPPDTPTTIPTDTPTPSPVPTDTPTAIPTDTPTLSLVPTDTPPPTDTPVPPDTPTTIPTDTPTVNVTPTSTVEPSPTGMPPVVEPTATLILPSPTFTPEPTSTALPPPILLSNEIVINEIYYDDPAVGDDSAYEWIELYNRGSTVATLSGWILGDDYSTDTIPQVTIAPGGFAVVAAGPGFYERYPSFGGTVAFVANGRLGNGLADSGDQLLLVSGEGNTADTFSYGNNTAFFSEPPSARPGRSLERVPPGHDTDQGSDFYDLAPSPGRGPRLSDLVVVSIVSHQEGGCAASTVLQVQVVVENRGEGEASGFHTTLNEGLVTWYLEGLAAGAAESLSCVLEVPQAAVYNATVDGENDVPEGNEENNTLAMLLEPLATCTPTPTPTLPPLFDSLLISEVLYDGSTFGTEGDEFVELCNYGSKAFSLEGYKVGDEEEAGGEEGMYLLPAGTTLEARSCLVVAKNAAQFRGRFGFYPDFETRVSSASYGDTPEVSNLVRYSAWGSGQWALSNDGDEVVLLDPVDRVVDVVAYEDGRFDVLGLRGWASAPQPYSLQRIESEDCGDMKADFVRADPNPGQMTVWPAPPGPPPAGFALPGGMNAYLGELHAHTNLSDGAGPAAYACAVARANGLHFLGLSDEAGHLSAEEWGMLGQATDAATQEGAFVALRGFEWVHSQAGRLSVFATEEFIFPDEPQGSSLANLYAWLATHPQAVAQFNGSHAGAFEDFAYQAAADQVVHLQEVGRGTGSDYRTYEAQYVQSLEAGWHVGPTNNANTHTARWGDDSPHRVGLVAPVLTRDNFLAALRARRVFATEDGSLALALRTDGVWMGSTVLPTSSLNLYVDFVDPDGEALTLTLYDRSLALTSRAIAQGTSSGTWSVIVPGSAGHIYFVKAVQADGDTAYTSPIWIEGEGAEDVVINEFLPAPREVDWDGNFVADYQDEWIELYNPGQEVVNLTGWQLDDVANGGGKPYVFPLDRAIPPQGFLVLYHEKTGLALNNDEDWVRLLRPDGSLADEYHYTCCTGYDRSWSRTEDGGELWAKDYSPTPGQSNRFGFISPTPEPTPTSSPAPAPTPEPRRLRGVEEIRNLPNKTPVIVVGWVTVPPPVLGETTMYIQDSTGGIMIYLKGGGFPPLGEGAWVEVWGQIRDYRGEREVKALSSDYIFALDGARLLPPTMVQTGQVDEEHEGLLVQVTGRVVGYGRKTLYLDDGSGEAKVYFRELKRPRVEEGDQFRVVGLVSQYTSKDQEGYRLLPRYESDVVKLPQG